MVGIKAVLIVLLLSVAGTTAFGNKSNASKNTTITNSSNLEDHEARLRSIQQRLQPANDLRVEFVETTYRALRGNTSESKGEARFSRPNKFRWTIKSPRADEWTYDGTTLYRFQPDQNQATRFRTQSDQSRQISELISLILDVDQLLNRYNVVNVTQDSNESLVELTPKNRSEVTSVVLTASTKQQFIRKIRVNYRNGNHTSITFSNPRFEPLPEAVFQFSAPNGVKIADF